MFQPNTKLEKFGKKVYDVLVENFPQTFFVGGMVRDILLKKEVLDIDIATHATPDQIILYLKKAGISTDLTNKKFGVIIARQNNLSVEIASFRKDLPSYNRYSKVVFVSDAKTDSYRRDFTINALYLSQKTNKILDFHKGLKDLNNLTLRFIGNPKVRITEDPLRILRALRFAFTLNFKIEKKSLLAIKLNFVLIKKLTVTRINKELNKISDKQIRFLIKNILDNKKMLDNYFK